VKIQVKLFAAARQVAGCETVCIELPESATVADLRTAIAARWPALDSTARHWMVAIDSDYASDSTVIPPDAEIACIPPVSGG
jgi:molybdopterin converting factor subunit 1